MSLRHPNIVTYIGNCYHKNDLYIITEYMEKSSLKRVLDNKKIELSFKDQLKICLDISLGIYYIHSRKPKVLHRDLKSSNCLVDRNLTVKLCDFGLSKIYENNNQQTNSSSTMFWMAPEFILKQTFTEKSDIYSLGILIWEIITRDTIPYKGINEINFLFYDEEKLKIRPKFPDNINIEIRKLIEACWNHEPTNRPDIAFIIESLEVIISGL